MKSELLELLENRDRGASALLARLLQIIPGMATSEIFEILDLLKQRFPLMAVWNYAESYFLEHQPTPKTITDFNRLILDEKYQVIQRALERLVSYQVFLTISRSSLVEEFLLSRSRNIPLQVICSESLPGREGVALSKKLHTQGIHSELVADWEIRDQVRNVDAILMGADWVSSDSFINKWGSMVIIEEARRLERPTFVFAETFKRGNILNKRPNEFDQDWSQGRTRRIIKVFETIPRSEDINLI